MKTMIPHPYQEVGAVFLTSRPGAILNDRVGLGKTLTSLLAVKNAGLQQVLIICPKNLKPWWAQEIGNVLGHDDVRVVEIDYNDDVHTIVLRDGTDHEFVLAHYEQFINNSKTLGYFLAQDWDAVIVDEVHKIKNRKAQRSKNIKKLKTKHKWGLTGTAIADKPDDLWGILNWIAPQSFPHYWPFVKAYCDVEPGHAGEEIVGIKAAKVDGHWSFDPTLALLRYQTAPHILTRTLEDVGMELPELVIQDIPLEMGNNQREFYRKVRREVIISLEKEAPEVFDFANVAKALVITEAGARFTRLHQAASAPTTFFEGLENAKLDWLREYLEDGGEPSIIFTRYLHTVDEIEAVLAEAGAEGFIVGTYASLSTGHNFQHLHNIIMWDLPYSRLTYEQSLGRCYRQGQNKPVFVRRLLLKGTVDYRVRQLIDHKQAMVDMINPWLRGLYDKDKEVCANG